MKSDVQREIEILKQLEKAYRLAASEFSIQYQKVMDMLNCPVCKRNIKFEKEFGWYHIRCNQIECGFHVGKSERLSKLLDRWTAVCDTIEETKKEEVKECE